MANIKGQIKRNRQNEKRRIRNKGIRSEINSRVKKAIENAESGNHDAEDLKAAIKRIDKAVAKNIMHKNSAARKKSRLTKKLNSLDNSLFTLNKVKIVERQAPPLQSPEELQ